MGLIEVSIIIPVYNEEQVLGELYKRVITAMSDVSELYEVIFVNDNSNDKTLELLTEFHKQNDRIKVLTFSRNFGHQMAINAGIEKSSGRAVIIMDGDLQDPPELIKCLVDKWREGYEVVYAVRRKRKESAIKKVCYKSFYMVFNMVSNIDMPQDAGDFGLIDKKIVDIIKKFPERHFFFRGLRCWVGFNQASLEYNRGERFSGESKYSFMKLLRLAFDGIFGFSLFPLRVAILLGFIFSIVGIFLIFFVLFVRFFTVYSVPGFASTATLILFFSGIQLVIIGILGEYIGRIYTQVNMRPKYIIKDTIGFE